MIRFVLLLLLVAIVFAADEEHGDDDHDGHDHGKPIESPEMEMSESPEPEDDPVCVDVKYLTSLGHDHEDFVHKTHRVAPVYCPPGLPCGTRYHQIRVDGVGMSYGKYCEKVECERKKMQVNSVFSHVWEEKEMGGVVLTMYDDRYFESGQKVLHWVMKKVRQVGI